MTSFAQAFDKPFDIKNAYLGCLLLRTLPLDFLFRFPVYTLALLLFPVFSFSFFKILLPSFCVIREAAGHTSNSIHSFNT